MVKSRGKRTAKVDDCSEVETKGGLGFPLWKLAMARCSVLGMGQVWWNRISYRPYIETARCCTHTCSLGRHGSGRGGREGNARGGGSSYTF